MKSTHTRGLALWATPAARECAPVIGNGAMGDISKANKKPRPEGRGIILNFEPTPVPNAEVELAQPRLRREVGKASVAELILNLEF